MSCASPWNARSRSHAAGPDASPFWPRGGFERGESYRGGWWRLGPVAFAGMIVGFVFFWPVGLAILAYNILTRKGYAMPFADMMDRAVNRAMERTPFARPATTGNMAFDEWRQAELERIEKERQRLADAEREFAAFSEELRRAKDREEFERFRQARQNGNQGNAA